MLDRSPQDDAKTKLKTEVDTELRPVAFRGAGFTPRAGRYSGWIALLLVVY